MKPVNCSHFWCGSFIVMLLLSCQLWAATAAVGNITAVLGKVELVIASTGEKRTAVKGDAINENDKIQTLADAKAKVILNDETVLSIGPNAELVIDKFVLNSVEDEGSVGISLKKGLFKYLSGNIAKNKGKVELKIPNAVITVRGTSAVINIPDDGVVSIKTLTGELNLTNAAGVTTQITAGYEVKFNSGTSSVTSFTSFADGCKA